jgi:hemerythrin-like domain-containing protein
MSAATDVLRREHRDIALVARVAEELLYRRATDTKVGIREMPAMTNYFLRFADYLHHAKEEAVLFPAILRHDANQLSILDTLLTDHQHLRAILSRLVHAVEDGDPAAYFDALQGYLILVRSHMRHENEELLPQADRLIPREEQEALAGQLILLQTERMPDTELADLEAWRRLTVDS